MKKFFCFGLKDFCGCDILCADCTYYDNSGGEYREAPISNADHIRSMTDEELAKFLLGVYCRGWSHGADDNEDADINFAEWLKQIYKEGTLP